MNTALRGDAYFLHMAKAASAAGDCRRRQVGAVLVCDGHIVSVGYNHYRDGRSCIDGACPRGLLSFNEIPAGADYFSTGCEVIHAEQDCLQPEGVAVLTDPHASYILYVSEEPCEPVCWPFLLRRKRFLTGVVWPGGRKFLR